MSDSQREAFERWHTKQYISTEALEWDGDGYADFDHNRAWKSWQAALASVSAEPVQATPIDDATTVYDTAYVREKFADYQSQIDGLREELRTRKAAAPPEGWALVPVEPTQEMMDAWNNSGADDFKIPNHVYSEFTLDEWADWVKTNSRKDWSSMLDAAPTPPASQEGVNDE